MADQVKRPLLRAKGVAPLAAASFVIIVLIIFNVSNWRMMKLLENSKEDDLARRVRSVTRVSAESLASPAAPYFLSVLAEAPAAEQAGLLDSFADSEEYEVLADRLAQLKAKSGLAQILLLSRTGAVISDSNYRFLTGEPLPFSIDSQYLAQALAGDVATTPLYAWEGEHFQRDYEALVDDDGTTLGVVMGSISADYLDSLRLVRSRVLRLWLLSSVVVILLGIWLYRTFRYVARLERHALQRVRVEAMGALAAGMAHELRNPLAIIRALAEEVRADQPGENRSTENADDIIAETQRLSDLVTHFLSLSRAPAAGESGPVDLKNEVERVAQLMRKAAPEGFVISLDLPPDAVWVRGDVKAVRQLLLNLFLNAREAMGDDGPGRIEVGLRERRQKAELRIRDHGPGISAKVLARAFEPFYTTRKSGTGLGLSISRGIADNMGGELSLESTAGRGTTAVVSLPVAEAEGARD